MKKRFALLGALAMLMLLCGPALTAQADMPEGPPLYETCNNGINAAPETEEPINEHCEDYNDVETDDCLTNCKLNECGDGFWHHYASDTDPENNIPDAKFAKGPMPLEGCDDGNDDAGDGCSPACADESLCGNGTLDLREPCDDGNTDDGDGCNRFCMKEGLEAGECGNGVYEPENGEECDDGDLDNTDVCDNLCHWSRCGDGVVNGDEECDDGDTFHFDECGNNCKFPDCGDGILNGTDTCDDGGICVGGSFPGASCTTVNEDTVCTGGGECLPQDGDGCSANCQDYTGPQDCGDGNRTPDEQCDDNNNVDNDGCSADCLLEYCGDGIVNEDTALDTLLYNRDMAGEAYMGFDECDDGNLDPSDGCDTSRMVGSQAGFLVYYMLEDLCIAPVCGNGDLEGGEECDDDNNEDGDGCSAECLLETELYCGDGVVDEGEECDDGNKENHDICRDNCEYNVEAVESGIICGDGVVMTPEECDDGNTVNGDGCTNSCARECAVNAVDASGACTDYVPLPSDALLPVFAEAGATTDESVNGDTTGGDSTTDTEATGTGGGDDGTLDGAGVDADGDSDGGCALIPTAMPTTAGLSLLLLGLGSLAAVRRRR